MSVLTPQCLADSRALPKLGAHAAALRRHLAQAPLVLALLLALVLAACGGGTRTSREPGAPGKIEALREAQERAQQKIEAEGTVHARQAQLEQEAARREAEREAGGG